MTLKTLHHHPFYIFINSWTVKQALLFLKDWRIQAEEHHQNTPDGTNVDLFTGIHHKVIALSEEVDAHWVDGKVNKPLVLHKEPKNCTQNQSVECGKQKHILYKVK